MDDLKKQVESLLFSAGRKLEIAEIAKLLKARDISAVLEALEQLRGNYEAQGGSLMVVQDGTAWKLTVREAYLQTVRRIVTQTELPKSVMETLAVIAYKNPVLQSHIIKVRTNKAYDHLGLLEQDGFLTRVKHGRTKLIRLAPKFFDYFDIPEDQLKQKFSNVLAVENAIKEKEGDMEARQKAILEKQEEVKRVEDAHKKHVEAEHKRLDAEIAKLPDVELVDEEGEAHKLKAYPTTPIPPEEPRLGPDVEVITEAGMETYGEPEVEPAPMPGTPKPRKKKQAASVPTSAELARSVVEEAPSPTNPVLAPAVESSPDEQAAIDAARKEAAEELARETEEFDETAEEKMEALAQKIASGEEKPREFLGQGMFPGGVTAKMAKRIDERVEELVHGEKKPGQAEAESDEEESEDESAPVEEEK
jgi:segregation and condensation protein B